MKGAFLPPHKVPFKVTQGMSGFLQAVERLTTTVEHLKSAFLQIEGESTPERINSSDPWINLNIGRKYE